MANNERIDALLHAAQREGVLPADAAAGEQEARPWPVVLLTALGAWLAAIPLLAVVGMLFNKVLQDGGGLYFAGVLLLAAAFVLLRSRDLPVFVEQLALPALLVGGGALAVALFRDLPDSAAAAAMGTISLVLAWALPRPWLRVLLGAAAAAFATVMLVPGRLFADQRGDVLAVWLALHAALAVWLAAMALERRLRTAAHARHGAVLDSTATGWVLLLVAALAWWSGMTFLVGGAAGAGFAADVARAVTPGRMLETWLPRAVSVACSVAAAGVIARAWPSLRTLAAALVAALLAVLAGFMPALGAVLLALACAAATQRWQVAAACAVAAAWIVGAFYYQLQWPLGTKALVLVAVAAAMGAVAWGAAGLRPRRPAAVSRLGVRSAAFITLGALGTLAAANYAIWDKEQLIAHGEKVFVQLAPVDPRSLMQGDYMRLNYSFPGDTEDGIGELLTARPYLVVRRDARGVAQPLRVVQAHEAVAPGEMRIELTPKGGRWMLVSDAWYFTEGDGARWSAAKYGEFRVLPDGRALLVGLADEQLRTIPAKP